LCSQDLEEPTEEQISQAYNEDSARISAALATISRTQVLAIDTRPNAGTSLLDLSGLVELRAAHETLQAHNGVRNLNRDTTAVGVAHSAEALPKSGVSGKSDFGSARQQIVKQFYQLLRDADAEGERVGTGLHRSHVWAGPSGNSLNAEKVAERRTTKVCSLLCPICGEQCAHSIKGKYQTADHFHRDRRGKTTGWGSCASEWGYK